MARTSARHLAGRRPSTALTAFGSFSALVAVSVALSNGSATSPWEAARADGPAQEQPRGTFGQPAGQATAQTASLFAAIPDRALIDEARKASAEHVAGQVRTMSDRGTGAAASSVAPTKRAPATYQGELPVNTIIAPAQPTTVLDGGRFGWRTAPDTGAREFHNGTDVSAPEGTPVVAAMDGTVTATFWDEWGGNRVEVSHADGMKTTYNHLEDVMVQVGDPLRASEQLGTVGQTGLRVTGPHLHFETWVQGKVVDAQSFDWETGQGVIPASRPKYSMADQAQAGPAVSEDGSVPGTDNGPTSDVPATAEEFMALGGEADAAPSSASAAERDEANSSAGDTAEKAPQRPTPATAPKPAADALKPQPAQDAAPQADENTRPGPSQQIEAEQKAAADRAAREAADMAAAGKAASDKAAAEKAAEDTADKAAQAKPDATKPQPAPGEQKPAPAPSKPAAPQPKPTPDKTPEGDGQTGPAPAAPKPTAPKPTPADPVLDPLSAPITELTTLEQLQQRTKALLDEQLKLPVAQQFGPGSQLKAQLPLLTQQLVTAKVDTQAPEFTAQLTAAESAVDRAAAAPTDPQLTAAATAELTMLQKMLTPDPAPAPAK